MGTRKKIQMNQERAMEQTVTDTNVDDTTVEEAREWSTDDASDPTKGGDGNTEQMPDVLRDDRGMSTIEYALGCVAAAALGALLYLVVTSDAVENALTSIFQRALDTQ